MNFEDIKKIYYYLEEEKNLTDFTDFFDYNPENFYLLKKENEVKKLANTKFYNSASLIFMENFGCSNVLNFFDDFFSNNPEIFHKAFIYSKEKITFEFLKDLNEVFYKYKNYYDLYKSSIDFSDDSGFSKVFHILVELDFNADYIEVLKEEFFC